MGQILILIAAFLSRRLFYWIADTRSAAAQGQRRRRSLPPQAGGTDLAGLDLRGADLARRMFWRGNLAGANLRDADLGRSNLREARLTGADLRHANLEGADLRGADLTGADPRGARLREAKLDGVRHDGTTRWPWRGRPPVCEGHASHELSPAPGPEGRGDELAASQELR